MKIILCGIIALLLVACGASNTNVNTITVNNEKKIESVNSSFTSNVISKSNDTGFVKNRLVSASLNMGYLLYEDYNHSYIRIYSVKEKISKFHYPTKYIFVPISVTDNGSLLVSEIDNDNKLNQKAIVKTKLITIDGQEIILSDEISRQVISIVNLDDLIVICDENSNTMHIFEIEPIKNKIIKQYKFQEKSICINNGGNRRGFVNKNAVSKNKKMFAVNVRGQVRKFTLANNNVTAAYIERPSSESSAKFRVRGFDFLGDRIIFLLDKAEKYNNNYGSVYMLYLGIENNALETNVLNKIGMTFYMDYDDYNLIVSEKNRELIIFSPKEFVFAHISLDQRLLVKKQKWYNGKTKFFKQGLVDFSSNKPRDELLAKPFQNHLMISKSFNENHFLFYYTEYAHGAYAPVLKQEFINDVSKNNTYQESFVLNEKQSW